VYGTVQNRSDERDKADIRDTTLGLDFIQSLRPVDYKWDLREDYKELRRTVREITVVSAVFDCIFEDLPVIESDLPVVCALNDDGTLEITLEDPEITVTEDISITLPDFPDVLVKVEYAPTTLEHPRDESRKRTRYHHGLIAQEVPETFGGVQHHSIKGGEDVYTLGYDEFIGPLIKAVQELAAENELLKTRISALES
jgi:hypothetical protein